MVLRANAVFSSKRLAWALLGWCLCVSPTSRGVNGQEFHVFQPLSRTRLESHECPESCKNLFLKLEDGPVGGGGMVQHVEVRERGEPKSGTGFMFEWAGGALAHSCMYLQSAYGGKSCRIEWKATNRTLIFDPRLASKDPGPCACDDVDSVVISMFNFGKHTLPVEADCNWSRGGGITKGHHTACTAHWDSSRLQNQDELWDCVRASGCRITDESLQMAVMRDPRAVAVSAYFHHLQHDPLVVQGVSVDEFALSLLPVVCQWVSIRYLLFTEILAKTSKVFWYDDAKANPLKWHQELLFFVGLRVPDDVVSKSVEAAERGGRILGFPAKGVDMHEGGKEATARRSFTDEITATTLLQMNTELSVWLPADVMKRIGFSA